MAFSLIIKKGGKDANMEKNDTIYSWKVKFTTSRKKRSPVITSVFGSYIDITLFL